MTAFTDLITTLQEPRFMKPLSATVVLAEGTQGEPLQKSVDVLLAGKEELKKAIKIVSELANTRL